MSQLALVGLGKSGANLLPLVDAPCNLFLLGNVNFPEAYSLSPIQRLQARNLPRFAGKFNSFIVVGDPVEKDFGPLLQTMSSFLSRKAAFLAAFVASDEEAAPASTLRNIASTINCFFQPLQSCVERKAQAGYLQQIVRFFINVTSSNFVCLDLEDLVCCLRRNLSAFLCSASASGPDAGIDAARQLAEKIDTHNPRKFASSIIHMTLPSNAPSSEIVNCCNYLGRRYHLGEWLFSVSRKNESSFAVDFLGASHIKKETTTLNMAKIPRISSEPDSEQPLNIRGNPFLTASSREHIFYFVDREIYKLAPFPSVSAM